MAGTWRDTLFVWSGPIKISNDKKVEWSGTWFGCEDSPNDAELPSKESFADSNMKFEVSGTVKKTETGSTVIAMDGGTGWDLQGDDKIDRHGDDRHILVCSKPEDQEVVAAVGENNFGAFVSVGFLITRDTESLWLTLARRYLDDRDVRSKWTPEELIDKITAEGSTLEEGILPWNNKELHAETLTKRKTKRKRT